MKKPEADPIAISRGDILWINCDPSVGVEPRKTRACVVVSNDLANRYGATVTVVPTLSYDASRAARPFNIDLRAPRSTLKAARVANVSAVTTYDRIRVVSRAGSVSSDTMARLDRALAAHLGLAELPRPG